MTAGPWTSIANLGNGSFFQVEQAGSAVAYATPFDEEIAKLSAELDSTRIWYGSREERERKQSEIAEVEEIIVSASTAAKARRGIFNAAPAGRENLLGDKELVDAVTSGDVDLAELDADNMPAALVPLAPEEQAAYIDKLAAERADLQQKIRQLAEDRESFIAQKVEEAGGLESSLDKRLYEAVKEQAGKAGLEYSDGPAY